MLQGYHFMYMPRMPPGAAQDPFKADFVVKSEVRFLIFLRRSECIGGTVEQSARQKTLFKARELFKSLVPRRHRKLLRKAVDLVSESMFIDDIISVQSVTQSASQR